LIKGVGSEDIKEIDSVHKSQEIEGELGGDEEVKVS
jgi:hypothetical protein